MSELSVSPDLFTVLLGCGVFVPLLCGVLSALRLDTGDGVVSDNGVFSPLSEWCEGEGV